MYGWSFGEIEAGRWRRMYRRPLGVISRGSIRERRDGKNRYIFQLLNLITVLPCYNALGYSADSDIRRV